jgi:hypothetical protein
MNNCNPKDCEKLYSSKDKWVVAVLGGLLFMLLSSPFLYSVFGNLFNNFGIKTAVGACPTMLGLLLHTIVFVLIVRALLN